MGLTLNPHRMQRSNLLQLLLERGEGFGEAEDISDEYFPSLKNGPIDQEIGVGGVGG